VRCRGDLALVNTAVSMLRVLDLERPVVRMGIVDRSKSLVVCVRVTTNREQMDVPVPDPRYL
jgi:hypothetical protein